MKTDPELFIIESLQLEDERNGVQEGDIISRMLQVAGKQRTRYYYIRTRREMEEIIPIFGRSRLRYLHISCHANKHGMHTTFDFISYRELGKILAPHIFGRRVFVSACKMARKSLARELFGTSGLLSLIGPRKNINFDDSAAFWMSFYHLMFKTDSRTMKKPDLNLTIRALASLYHVKIRYFSRRGSTFASKSF